MTDMPPRPLLRIIRAEDAESWVDGYAFLERAKSHAAALRATVQDEIAQAREAGRIEGRRAGELEAAGLLAQTQAEIDRHLALLEPRICDLALDIVRRVLGSFSDAELVARAARHALTAFREEQGVVVNVAPGMDEEVARHLAAIKPEGPDMRVEPDRHLSRLQCVVTTPSASLDVGIEAQLGTVREALVASIEEGAR